MTRGVRQLRLVLFVAALTLAAGAPARAHHMSAPRGGGPIGVAIPAISHGEMPVIAKYRTEILDLAARQPQTDPTLRRLGGFVSLQHFACLWGLIPGSMSDEDSPLNECAHADLAGTRALLAHMATMPGDQSAAKALMARIEAELAADPARGAICSSSREDFDSGIVVGPDWGLAPTHPPTILTFLGLVLLAAAGTVAATLRKSAA